MEIINQSSSFDNGDADNLLTRGSLLYDHAARLASANIVEETTIRKLRTVVDLLTEKEEFTKNLSFQPDLEYTGVPGRPKIRVTEEQLYYLAVNGYKARYMARMIGISEATVQRRLKDFNIEIS